MKKIVMTTESPTPVSMGAAGVFETGKEVLVDDGELAGQLLNRSFPKFVEFTDKPAKQIKSTSEVADHG